MAKFAYTPKAQALQKRFDTQALAAAELQVIVHDALTEQDKAFVRSMEMFWLATVDPQGSPTVSFKGGAPGFVRIADDQTLLFPCFDGNGMFFSMGNIAHTSHIGMLFMDFVTPSRLRVQGDAELTDDPDNVVKGKGPCNEQRLAARNKAWEEGAWFREALSTHAAKQQAATSQIHWNAHEQPSA